MTYASANGREQESISECHAHAPPTFILTGRGLAETLLRWTSLLCAIIVDKLVEVQEVLVDVDLLETAHKVCVVHLAVSRYGGQATDVERSRQVKVTMAGLRHISTPENNRQVDN